MTNIAALKIANASRWNAMKVLASAAPMFDAVAARLNAPVAKDQYLSLSIKTHVPWYAIAVIHQSEASQSWAANIANGQRWNQKTTIVPKGRGPFTSWQEAGIDALTNCAPFAAKWTDWSVGGLLTLLEEYNGLGYADMGRPSPYIWCGTDQYVSGKYVADGHYDPAAVDTQLGCAALIATIANIGGQNGNSNSSSV